MRRNAHGMRRSLCSEAASANNSKWKKHRCDPPRCFGIERSKGEKS